MPDDYKELEFDAPVKENQTRAQLAGVATKDVQKLRKLVKGEREPRRVSPAEQKRREALESHMATSGTRRTIDAFCFVAYIALGMELVLSLVGQAGLIQAIWWLPNAMRTLPLMIVSWIRPGVELGTAAGDAIALAMIAVAHIVLRAIHLRVTIQRMGL